MSSDCSAPSFISWSSCALNRSAVVIKQLILPQVAEQQEMVGSHLWVARPEIQQRYNLPTEVSQETLNYLTAPPPPPVPIPTKGKRSSSKSRWTLLFCCSPSACLHPCLHASLEKQHTLCSAQVAGNRMSRAVTLSHAALCHANAQADCWCELPSQHYTHNKHNIHLLAQPQGCEHKPVANLPC